MKTSFTPLALILLGCLLGTAVRPSATAAPLLETSEVFPPGFNGIARYRIPGMVVTTKGTVLAYCEARRNNSSDWGEIEVHLRRSTDGGKTWQQVLRVNSDTGASDLSMDPTNPRILYAAMWHHGRKPWFIKSGGEGGGIYKSTDSGDSWEKL